ncbi:hypothetical protein FB45DRAFT_946645 [Roridomyces roridus]|uniref:ANK_REP_REGION domain-containing protein n=1 Tax=Roridomyces roridus TaxID=1738132 RepID=A0AAD7B3C6_9AGAR|nr:hypothetical protein FB45DRAFT_946645 [Roridomyces roridus]
MGHQSVLLIRMARLHCTDCAKLLIDHGASLDATDKDGWTPLQHASSHSHLCIAKLLLAHNTSLDLIHDPALTVFLLVLKYRYLDIDLFQPGNYAPDVSDAFDIDDSDSYVTALDPDSSDTGDSDSYFTALDTELFHFE